MTKQEQIEEMRRELYCAMSKVNGIASSGDLAEALYDAGYGNVSEYKAERELLGSKIKVLEQRLNNKYIEVDNLNRDYQNSFERLKAQEREIMQLKANKKQVQIDVLNKVKEHLFFGVSLDFLRLYVDELIEEVEKQ